MIRQLSLSLLLGSTCLTAQDPVDRPEKLSYPPLRFELPRSSAFKATLKNGIPVYILAEPDGIPFVRLNLSFRGGSYLDPKGKEGLASLVGSQWRAGGTEKTPADALDERIEFLAAKLHSRMGETSGSLSLSLLEKDLAEGMGLFMEVLTRPAFSPERLSLAKSAAQESMMRRNDETSAIAEAEMKHLLNGDAHFTAAEMTAASLGAITREDLRAFHARLMHPGNLVVSVSGKFKRQAMLDLLNRTLGNLKPGPSARISPKVPAPDSRRAPGIYVVDKDVPQSTVSFALPGLRRTDPDWPAAAVMNELLGGGGFTSRLMKKIRSDEGLVYGIGTALGQGAYWRGDWKGGFQTKNASVPYALRLTLAEIDRIKTQPIGTDELQVIKDGIIQAFPAQWSNRQDLLRAWASEHIAGWPEDWWVVYRARIQAVTAEDVQRVARKYLDASPIVILVVGKAVEAEGGDPASHPGLLKDVAPLSLKRLPLRDPLTLKPRS